MSIVERVNPEVAQLAAAFSPPVFRDLGRPLNDQADPRLSAVLSAGRSGGARTLGEAFDQAHATLQRDYRTEYVYKNHLVSKIVFGRHSPRTASALMEVRMGGSCADVVIVNGTSTTYEVKTDLDDFSRLRSQLEDYSTRTEFVHVVTSERRSGAAATQVPQNVGVLAIRGNGALRPVVPARSNLDSLDVDHLFQLLRTHEALRLLNRVLGYELDVQPGYAWPRMRELFAQLPAPALHLEVVRELKDRGSGAARMTSTPGFPSSLRALAYSTELSRVAAERTVQRLT